VHIEENIPIDFSFIKTPTMDHKQLYISVVALFLSKWSGFVNNGSRHTISSYSDPNTIFLKISLDVFDTELIIVKYRCC
jgi:hypothetical protein